MQKNKAPITLPPLKISPKKKNKANTIPTAQIATINQIFNLVPLGSNPITQLGLKWRQKEDYEELKYILQDILEYPSTDLADLHRDCNRLGSFDILENQEKLSKMIFEEKEPEISCSCCGYVLQSQQISITTSLSNIGNMGISTHLYFLCIITIILLLVALFLIYGVFALVTNITYYNSISSLFREQIQLVFNYLSISLSGKQLYRTDQSDYFYWVQCWLGLVVCLIWILMFIGVKYIEKNYQLNVDDKTISAADFSVVIEGVPTKITKNELQKQLDLYYELLTENQKPKQIDRPFKIAKINKATPFYLTMDEFMSKELKKTIEEKNEQRKKFVEWILERQNNFQFSVPKEQRLAEYNKFRSLESEVDQRYAHAVNKVVEQMREKNKAPKTSVYVTFQSHFAKELICYLNSPQKTKIFFPCCNDSTYFKIAYENQIYKTKVKQAPEPQDIIWTNIGQSYKEKLCRKIVTYTVTAFLLGGSFTVIYFLSQLQIKLSNDAFLSFIISISITVINLIIQIVIRILTNLERQQTQTSFQTNLAVKSTLGQVINSIVLPFIVKYFVQRNLYKVDGLAFVVFSLGISNSFIVPLLSLTNIDYISYKVKYWAYKKLSFKLSVTQDQLNAISTLGTFEIGSQYIYPVNLFLFICFYVSLQPVVCVFGIGGLLLMYYINKHTLLTKSRRPFPGNDLVNRVMYRALETGPFVFSLGNLTWSNLVTDGGPKSALLPNLIALVISGVFMFIPYKGFFSYLIKQKHEQELLFSQKRIFLASQYDRLNPMTAKQSLIQYSKFLRQFRQQIKQKTKQDLIDIELLMLLQKQRGSLTKFPLLQIFQSLQLDSLRFSNLSKDQNKMLRQQQSQQPVSVQQNHLIIKQEGIEQLKVRRKRKTNNKITPQSLFKNIFIEKHSQLNFVQNWVLQNLSQINQNNNIINQFIIPQDHQNETKVHNKNHDNQKLSENNKVLRQSNNQQPIKGNQLNYDILKNLIIDKQKIFLKDKKKQIKQRNQQKQKGSQIEQHQISQVKINPSQRKNKNGGILSMILGNGGTIFPEQNQN